MACSTMIESPFMAFRIPEHVEKFEQLKKQFPGFHKLEFFRHVPGVQGTKPDQPFGEKMFYKRWVQACENLGIDGLDLYAALVTRQSLRLRDDTAKRTLSRHLDIQQNKAFERYCRVPDHTAFKMAKARAEIVKGGGDVIEFKKVKNNK